MQKISDLPYKKLRQLSRLLDPNPSASQLSWEALIEQLPDDFYSANQVRNFKLLAMRQDTTPAYELLMDMGMRGVTAVDLRYYLEAMGHEQAKSIIDQPPGYRGFRRQSSSESTYSSMSGGSEPGGGGGGFASMRRQQFSGSHSTFSQSSKESMESSAYSACQPPQPLTGWVQGSNSEGKDRSDIAGPSAPSEEEAPPPYPHSSLTQYQLSFKNISWELLGIVTVIAIVVFGVILKVI